MKYVVLLHLERFDGGVDKLPMSFSTEAEAEAFVGPALLADCVLAIERTWRPTDPNQARDGED